MALGVTLTLGGTTNGGLFFYPSATSHPGWGVTHGDTVSPMYWWELEGPCLHVGGAPTLPV